MENGQVLTVEEQNKYLKELEEKGKVTIEEDVYFENKTYFTTEECIERLLKIDKIKQVDIDDVFGPMLRHHDIDVIYKVNNIEFIVLDYDYYKYNYNENYVRCNSFKLETINHFEERLNAQNFEELEEEYLNKEMSLWDLDSIREEWDLDLMHYDSLEKNMGLSFYRNGIEYIAYFTITKFVVNTNDDEIEIDLNNFKDDEEITLEKLKKIIGEEIERDDINWEESRCIITEIGF